MGRQVKYQYSIPPAIVCEWFACESVLEADFVSVLDGFVTHSKGREGDLAIAEFVMTVSLSAGRWNYEDPNDPAPAGRSTFVDMR